MAAGLLLLLLPDLKALQSRLRMRRRLIWRRKEREEGSFLSEHLRLVLQTAGGGILTPGSFLLLSALLFLIIFLVGIQSLTLGMTLLSALLVAALPYLLLRIRLENLRRRSSHEGESLVAEFLRQYRITGLNIYETLERVVNTASGIRISRRFLFRLLLELRDTGDPFRIRMATDNFAYGINTNWGRMLAHNIRMAAEKGTNVSLAVEDILIQLREARVLSEERRRMNSEAARMTLFLVPAMYGVTILLAIRYLELPFSSFLKNQFYTPEGLTFFLMILFLFIGNTALMSVINNQRFDY
ncbi:MAG: hypothetical protein IJO79_03580 [Firmicutes bacterium]|nr:hypothetical protein [Bacillota bacterium]